LASGHGATGGIIKTRSIPASIRPDWTRQGRPSIGAVPQKGRGCRASLRGRVAV